MRPKGLVPRIGVAVAALLLAACGPAAPAPQSQAPAQPATAAKPAAPAQQAPAAQPTTPAASAAQPAAKPAAPAEAKPAQPAAAKPPTGEARYLMGSTNATSSVYAFWVTLGKVINSNVPGVNVTVVETGATVDNIRRMGRGELQMGLITEDIAYQARNGIGTWKDNPVKELRNAFLYHNQPCPIIVREDSGVKKLEDLSGKDFNAGMRGSAAEANTKAMLEVLGIKPRYYTGSLDDALAATKDKRIVGFSKCFASSKVPDVSAMDLQTVTPIRVLGLTAEQEKLVKEKIPYMPFTSVEPGVYKADWNKEPIRAWAAVVGLGVVEKVPAEHVYAITKAAVEDNKPGGEGLLGKALAGVKDNDFVKLTMELGITPLHPGAIRYYQEIGQKIPEHLLKAQ